MLEGIIVLGCYICVLLLITYFATKATKTRADFLLGGRQNSGLMTAMAAGTSDMGSWLMMALPALAFSDGYHALWLPIALMLGAYLNWTIVAPRLRTETERLQALTIPNFLSKVVNEHGSSFKRCLALSIVVFFTIYVAASFVAGALLLQAVFDCSYGLALVVCSSAIIVYSVYGGFKAVSWIDFMQGLLMFAVLLGIFLLVYINVPSQPLGLSASNTLLTKSFSWQHVLSCTAWGLGYFGQFHIALRFMAVRSTRELPLAKWVCLGWMATALLCAVMVGILGRSYYTPGSLTKPEMLLLMISKDVAGPWMKALVCSAILSAIMSSASSQLLLASSALVDDLFVSDKVKDKKKEGSNRKLIWSRAGALTVAAVALLVAIDPQASVLSLVGIAWAGIGASFGPLMLFCLFWPKTNALGAGSGIIVGTLSVVLIELAIRLNIWEGVVSGGSLLPGFLCSSATIYLLGRLAERKATAAAPITQATPAP